MPIPPKIIAKISEIKFSSIYNFGNNKILPNNINYFILADFNIIKKIPCPPLEPNSKYETWGKSANARAIADYMVGINLSRYFSILNGTTLSVGRVQTPTLGLFVNRDLSI